MIIFSHPIHRKWNRFILKLIAIIFFIIVAVSLMSCNKLEFDPTTSVLKYIIQNNKKGE